ncbi:MAG: hypothetical protein ACRCZF_13915 [Gemmataceae bacterium]
MSGGELALAFVLLTAPVGPPEDPPRPDQWPALQRAMQQLAIEWEILDKNETKFIFASIDDFGKDLNILRRRYTDLRDAPRLADIHRFPDKSTIAERIRFNRDFRRTLDARANFEVDRADELRTVACETERLYQVWDAIRDAKCDYYYITVRRQALKRVKELVGAEAYAMGDLPPNVPTWRFAESR